MDDAENRGQPTTGLQAEWDRHALTYDLVYGETAPGRISAERGFYDFAFAELAGREVRDVLDLTAGTGLQAVELARAGLRVPAADLSAAMLERCRARAEREGVTLAGLRCRPARETAEIEAYDACLSAFGSLNQLLEDDELQAAFAAVHRALRPGGLFVFDVMNVLDAIDQFHAEVERSGERDGVRYRAVMRNRVDSWAAVLHSNERTELTHPDGRRETVEVELPFRIYTRREVLRLLDTLPWAAVRSFRGYEDRGLSEEERVFRMVFAAGK